MGLMQTPRQKKDALAAAQRSRASRQGSPVRRGAFPGTLQNPVIIWRSGSDLLAHVPSGVEGLQPGRAKATPELVMTVLCSQERTLLAGDRDDLRATARMISRTGAPEHVRAWNAINSTSNPFSVRTLASALAYCWWAPEHVDVEDVDSWAEAFGVTSPDRIVMLRSLADRAAAVGKTGSGSEDASMSSVKSLVSREAKMCAGAEYVGLAADCRMHEKIEALTTIQNDLTLADPGLLSYHEVDGSVCRLKDPVSVGQNRYEFQVVSPFRSKAGRSVVITDGKVSLPSSASGIISTAFRDGIMFITIQFRPRDLSWVESVRRASDVFHIRDKPFDGVRRLENMTYRWQKPKEIPVKIEGRDLPLDVVLAGGPA